MEETKYTIHELRDLMEKFVAEEYSSEEKRKDAMLVIMFFTSWLFRKQHEPTK